MEVDIQKITDELSSIFNEQHINQLYEQAEQEDIYLMRMGSYSIYIDVTFQGQTLKCMLDTGAQQNCMTLDAVNRMNLHNYVDTAHPIKIVGVAGESMTHGFIPYLPIEIGNFTAPTCFDVTKTEKAHWDCLIGFLFMRFYKVTIDFENNLLTIGGQKVPFRLNH